MKIRLFIALCSSWLIAAAQEIPSQLSLEEALAYAYTHNNQMINAGQDVRDAYAQKWVTIASGLPQIDGGVDYQNQLKRPVSLLPGEFFGGEPGTFIPVTFGQKQQVSATATLKQQIFNGSYLVGLQAIKTFIEISALSEVKTKIEVQKAVVNAYTNVLAAQESERIIADNIRQLKATAEETQKMWAQGMVEEEALEQIQITLANLENQGRNSSRIVAISRQMLNLLLGVALDQSIALTDDLSKLAAQELLEPVDDAFTAEKNIDYRLGLNVQEQKRLELKLQKSYALPSLNTFVNYNSSAFADTFAFTQSQQQWFDSSILGVNINMPIFSSLGNTAKTKRAKIAYLKAQNNLTLTQKQVLLQWEQAQSAWSLAMDNYYTSGQNLKLAERIEQKNQIKFKEGIASGFELREAQLQLYSAQSAYLQAMLDLINAKTALETLSIND
ncbi:MAG: TolC family protein [Flavobacteriaceae bacterium]|nr:TolC family protein [Flavobacteriaceae bacterium]MDP4755229.1 TolC family protein [Flavobacteriaceae bacterium]MDP4795146.1 TolC family protein [Flavobacteriaceae bacterium]MDP4886159.1 TolC family protein [Flavobacteriaceae bacterium]MDP4971836.1 TolC family protein [Flavobacteriaceae bacterium]